MMIVRLMIGALFLAGCAGPIGATLTGQAASGALGKVVVQGVLDANYNFHAAVSVGALAATDPAPGCTHDTLVNLGVPPQTILESEGATPLATLGTPAPAAPAPATFTPRVSDLISEGSVLYIRARQLEKAQGTGITIPANCKILVTDLLLQAGRLGARVLPGAGVLVPLQ